MKLTKRSIIAALLLILTIPLALNFILQIKNQTPVSIIAGNDGAPATWLQFWGTYLAAIASFVMAFVAYRQSEDNRNDNMKLREQGVRRTEYESKKQEYDLFEKRLVQDMKLYLVSRFTKIGRQYDTGDQDGAKFAQEQLVNELQLSNLYILRFWDPNAERGAQMCQYMQLLQRYNNYYVEHAVSLKECFSCPNPLCEILKICNEVAMFNNKNNDLTNKGFDVLMCLRKEVIAAYMSLYDSRE